MYSFNQCIAEQQEKYFVRVWSKQILPSYTSEDHSSTHPPRQNRLLSKSLNRSRDYLSSDNFSREVDNVSDKSLAVSEQVHRGTNQNLLVFRAVVTFTHSHYLPSSSQEKEDRSICLMLTIDSIYSQAEGVRRKGSFVMRMVIGKNGRLSLTLNQNLRFSDST